MINDVGGVTCFAGGLLQQRHGRFDLAVFKSLKGFFVLLDIHRSIVALNAQSPLTVTLDASGAFRVMAWADQMRLKAGERFRIAKFEILRLLSLSGLKMFLSSPLEAGFLFYAVDAAFLEDFVLRCHLLSYNTEFGSE